MTEAVLPRARPRITGVAARLTAVNMLGAATGFITGPLLARALGPAGRGDLAAVVVPFNLAAPILGLGIAAYAYRTLPRGQDPREVLGSLGLPLLVLGGVAVAAAVPVADLLAGGRQTVRLFLIISFLSMPLMLVGNLLQLGAQALERWRSVLTVRITPFAVTAVGIAVLYLAHRLTVASAAAATIAGSLLAIVPVLGLVRGGVSFRPVIARAGLSFGVKSWVGGLAQMSNGRLDQLLMIRAVAPRELGLYAVATTIAGASGLAAGALAPPLMVRIAAGETELMAQAVRIMIAGTVALNVLLALITPLLLAALFGPAFTDACPMVLILLVAQVPLAGVTVLSSALQADGAPMIPTSAELLALVITVLGLIVLLGPLGGIGAALVSFAAYSASFWFQVFKAHRRTGISAREFLRPSAADLRWALGRFGAVISSVGWAR